MRDINRILILIGKSEYDVMNAFCRCLGEEWENRNISVDMLYISEESIKKSIVGDYDAVFSINGQGLLSKYGCAQWKECVSARWYSFYLDHPLYHAGRLEVGEPDVINIFSSKSFAEYADKYYNYSTKASVVLEAGIYRGVPKVKYSDREHGCVFFGTYYDSAKGLREIEQAEEIYGIVAGLGIEHSNWNMEQLLEYALHEYNVNLSEYEFREVMTRFVLVEQYLRGRYREELIKYMVDAGIPVEVYGDGWKHFAYRDSQYLSIHSSISYYEMLDIMENSKIVLNVMPWCKDGLHDRLLNGMLSGALVLSNETTDLICAVANYEHMLLYNISNPQKAVDMIAYYISHEAEAERIAKKGYEWAAYKHTWSQRADQILKIMRGNEEA